MVLNQKILFLIFCVSNMFLAPSKIFSQVSYVTQDVEYKLPLDEVWRKVTPNFNLKEYYLRTTSSSAFFSITSTVGRITALGYSSFYFNEKNHLFIAYFGSFILEGSFVLETKDFAVLIQNASIGLLHTYDDYQMLVLKGEVKIQNYNYSDPTLNFNPIYLKENYIIDFNHNYEVKYSLNKEYSNFFSPTLKEKYSNQTLEGQVENISKPQYFYTK